MLDSLSHPVPWSTCLLPSIAGAPIAMVSFHVAARMQVSGATREQLGLTARQGVVAELMADGLTHREIAKALNIRPNTARRHCEQVLLRLGVHSRDAITAKLVNAGAIASMSER